MCYDKEYSVTGVVLRYAPHIGRWQEELCESADEKICRTMQPDIGGIVLMLLATHGFNIAAIGG